MPEIGSALANPFVQRVVERAAVVVHQSELLLTEKVAVVVAHARTLMRSLMSVGAADVPGTLPVRDSSSLLAAVFGIPLE